MYNHNPEQLARQTRCTCAYFADLTHHLHKDNARMMQRVYTPEERSIAYRFIVANPALRALAIETYDKGNVSYEAFFEAVKTLLYWAPGKTR
jgi:hypothetical protein